MIAEDYISFETAKFLKEKGFNEECCAFYVNSKECGIELFHTKDSYNYNNNVNPCISAPTLQMAMKWLRAEYNIDIVVFPHKRKKKTYYARVLRDFYIEHQQKCNTYVSYEEACEAAIKYCLENLI